MPAPVRRPTFDELNLSTGKRARLHRFMYEHGPANGTLMLLPIDQGLEHGPIDFFSNPESIDTDWIYRLAVAGNFSGMALHVGLRRGRLDAHEVKQVTNALRKVPQQIGELLRHSDEYRAIAEHYSACHSMFFMGRNVGFPIALEGALKLKEISYIHAEGYAAGELKHGPIAMLDPNIPVVAIATASKTYDKVISNIQEVRARQAKVLAIATQGDCTVTEHCDDVIYIPRTHELLTPLLSVIPLQLLAYHIAVMLGRDVDQPRNLAKSVTVE